MTSVNLTIFGLLCDIVGACGLAYELLFGYPKLNRQKIEETRLYHLEQFISEMLAGIDVLASPPYTTQEKEELKAQFLVKWNPRREELKTEISNLSDGHKEKSYLFGWGGALLLVLGFGLQIAGALVK